MNNAAVVAVAFVVFWLYERAKSSAGGFAPGTVGPTGAGAFIGRPPPPGGADGSPQAIKAANYSGTTTVGNSEQNIAHGIESAVGAVAGAAGCAYVGAGAVAPICAKVGAYLGPKAVQLGVFTTRETLKIADKTVDIAANVTNKVVSVGTTIASAPASLADRAWSETGKLPAPIGLAAKVTILPVKVAADTVADAAQGGKAIVGGVTSGVKSASHAVSTGVSKVLGWL